MVSISAAENFFVPSMQVFWFLLLKIRNKGGERQSEEPVFERVRG
jgi:hypothetical protein